MLGVYLEIDDDLFQGRNSLAPEEGPLGKLLLADLLILVVIVAGR